MNAPQILTGTVAQGEGEAVPVKPVVELPPAAKAWVDHIRAVDDQIRELEESKKVARRHLEAMLGDNETGLLGGQPVVRWSFVTSQRLDQKKLKKQAPDLVRECTAPQTTRRFTIVEPS